MLYRKFNTYTTQLLPEIGILVQQQNDRRRLSPAVVDRGFFGTRKAWDLGCGLNSDSDGCFSRQQPLEICSRFRQPNPQRDRRPPTKQFLRFADFRLALFGVVSGKRAVNNFRSGAGNVDYDLRELTNREFFRVPEVHRPNNPVAGFHEPNQAFDEIVDVAERTRLQAVAVDGDVVIPQCLNDKIRYHTAVVGVHTRTVCIEDSRHLDAQLVLAVVIEEQSFSTALALVIAGAWADGVHVAPIVFCLRVNRGVSIYLGRGGLQDLSLHAFGQTQHVDGAVDAGLGRLYRVELVVNR